MTLPLPKTLRSSLVVFLLSVIPISLAGPSWAQETTDGVVEAHLLPSEPVVTEHSVTIGGETVRYTAEAGTLPIREGGKTMARIFYVEYLRQGIEDRTTRPLLFSFNGGPGSSSVWMHMGYTGPRRVVYDDEGFALRPPGRLEDNPHSILDVADVVYIDPVATGFSRMVDPEADPHMYHGSEADIASVAKFIRLYLTRKDRWRSPRFVIGESYGTHRAAGLAGHLAQAHDIYLNGVVLVSMTGLGVEKGTDVSYATSLPQLSAVAWYHGQLGADLQEQPLRAVLDQAEDFAMGDYLSALVKGDRIDAAEREAVARRVARFLGISREYVEAANLRVDNRRFWKELLRDQRLTVGRLDSRYLGVDRDAAGEVYEYDPAMADWSGAFTDAVNIYLREELGYETDLEYNIFGDVRPWSREQDPPVGELLRRAMTGNPYLKVLVQGGYFDSATDYFGAVYTMSHLQPGGELKDRMRFSWYESGHMMYLRKEDLAGANDDLREFIRWSLDDLPPYPIEVAPGR
jgi:carboxypeptidase C (cathepsin A)